MVVYHSSPPPLTCFFPIGTPLSANIKLYADGGVPIEEKHIKGGGLLYDGYLQIIYLQINIYLQILLFQ